MNIPNRLSILRIILVPCMMLFFMVADIPYNYLIATVIFILAAFTDHLDGYIARKYNMVTDMGKFLDPIADKLLTTSALALLAVYHTIPNPYGVIILMLFVARDFTVGMLRQIAAGKGSIISADKLGKLKTVLLYIGIPVLIMYEQTLLLTANEILLNTLMITGYAVVGLACLFNIISGVNYIYKNRHVFLDSQKEKGIKPAKKV